MHLPVVVLPSEGVLFLRASIGFFFANSGYHKLFVKEVHEKVVGLFKSIGCYSPFVEWAVPTGEFLGGLGLIVGLLTPIAALGLIVIITGAILMDCIKEVPQRHPRDWADWIGKTIYVSEVQTLIILLAVLLIGPGKYSLDAVVLSFIK